MLGGRPPEDREEAGEIQGTETEGGELGSTDTLADNVHDRVVGAGLERQWEEAWQQRGGGQGDGVDAVEQEMNSSKVVYVLERPIAVRARQGCHAFASMHALLAAAHVGSSATPCALLVVNPTASIAIVKAVHDAGLLREYSSGLESWRLYAALHGYALVVYVAAAEDWGGMHVPHFCKIAAVERALAMGFSWAVLSDLDSYVANPHVRVEDVLAAAPAEAWLVLQDEKVVCSCLLV
jgi:hypothetical protein